MKTIITVLFFAGFLTTASFAQSGHRQQNNNQSNGKGYQSQQSSGNNRDQYSQKSRNGNGGYSDNQWDNRNNQNNYGYNRDRDKRDRGDMKAYHNNYGSDNQRGFDDHSYKSWSRKSGHHRMYRDDNRD